MNEKFKKFIDNIYILLNIYLNNNFYLKYYIWNYCYYKYISFFINYIFVWIFFFHKFLWKDIIYNNNNKKLFKKLQLGFYLDYLKEEKKKLNFHSLIVRFKRKNLFLTVLNNLNNVVLKTNLGSSGFKKRIKFTGYAIENSTANFLKKIEDVLKKYLILKVNSLWENYNKLESKYSIFKQTMFIANQSDLNYLKKDFNNEIFFKISCYRKYLNYYLEIKDFKFFKKKVLEKCLFLYLILKSNLKYWAFNYMVSGLVKTSLIFLEILDKKPILHFKGFRLKKKRRV